MSPQTIRLIKLLSVASAGAVLAACGSLPTLSGGGERATEASTNASVNRYLWRATLDTIDFMPIERADPQAGLITTDWFGNPNLPQERFKTNVYILDTALRADALRVSVFKQQLTEVGWIDAPVNPATEREMENAILTRARQLRLSSLDD